MTSTSHEPRRRPEERPGEILEAALEEFGASGLAGARISDIASRAGIAKGTVYLYFESKDDLFRAVVRKTIEDAMATLSAAAVGESSEDRISALIPALWAIFRSNRFHTIYRLIYAELDHFPELSRFYNREVAGRISAFIADLIRTGMDSGEFRPVEPDVAARMLVALCVKHAMWLSRPDLFRHLASRSDEEVQNDITEFFFSAVEAR